MYKFELYLNRANSNASKTVISNVNKLLSCYLKSNGKEYNLDIIDVSVDMITAKKSAVFATPVLIKKEPLPERRIFGTFIEFDKVAKHLEID